MSQTRSVIDGCCLFGDWPSGLWRIFRSAARLVYFWWIEISKHRWNFPMNYSSWIRPREVCFMRCNFSFAFLTVVIFALVSAARYRKVPVQWTARNRPFVTITTRKLIFKTQWKQWSVIMSQKFHLTGPNHRHQIVREHRFNSSLRELL